MTVIELLENELKRVRKINYRLLNRPKGTVQEKDLERYKKEMEENDKYERDIVDSIQLLKEKTPIKKDTEYGEYSGKAYVNKKHLGGGFWLDPELARPVTRELDEQPQTTMISEDLVRLDEELRRQREMFRITHEQNMSRWNHNWYALGSAAMSPWSDGPITTGYGVFTSEGMQTPLSTNEIVDETYDEAALRRENEATDERND